MDFGQFDGFAVDIIGCIFKPVWCSEDIFNNNVSCQCWQRIVPTGTLDTSTVSVHFESAESEKLQLD